MWIPPGSDLDDILNSSAGLCRHDADLAAILRDRLFVDLRKHAHFFELLFDIKIPLVQVALPVKLDAVRIQAVFAVSFVNIDRAGHFYILTITQLEFQPRATARKHNTGKSRNTRTIGRSAGFKARAGYTSLFQCKIDVPRGMILTVRDLSANTKAGQNDVAAKHVLDVTIYLGYTVYVLLHTLFCLRYCLMKNTVNEFVGIIAAETLR